MGAINKIVTTEATLANGVKLTSPGTSQINFSDGTNTATLDLDHTTNVMRWTNNQNRRYDFNEALVVSGTSAAYTGAGIEFGYDGTFGFIDTVDRSSGFDPKIMLVSQSNTLRTLEIEGTNGTLGIILRDTESTVHRWRMQIDGSGAGAWTFSDLGAA